MDCSEEVVILERRLKPLSGLEAVSADLIHQRLHVKYDAARLTTSTICFELSVINFFRPDFDLVQNTSDHQLALNIDSAHQNRRKEDPSDRVTSRLMQR